MLLPLTRNPPPYATETANRLQFQQYAEEQNLRESFGNISLLIEEEALDSASLVADSFLEEGGLDAILTMVNFSGEEFNHSMGCRGDGNATGTDDGPRRQEAQNDLPPREAFFMDLTVPKHYDTWAKLAVDVQLQAAAFEKMRYKVYAIIEPVLCEHYVRPPAIAEQRAAGNTFANFQYAIYATDATFQSAYRPAGSFIEQKQYLSRKHKSNGYKLECSVAYPGFAVSISVHAPGSKYDLMTMMERADIYRSMLNKTRIEKAELDIGEGVRDQTDDWEVLVNMCYHVTKRKPRGETLSHDDLARNDIVASDHILVENLSGSKLWHVMFATYFRGLVWH